MTSPVELLSCPFCGSPPVFVDDDSYGCCQIFCRRCEEVGCIDVSAHGTIEMISEVISAWNWRPALDEAITEAMLIAARDWSYAKYGKPIGDDAAKGCYNVMQAAKADSGKGGDNE